MKYKRKPITVNAIQLTTDNYEDVCCFVGGEGCTLLQEHIYGGTITYRNGITTPFLGVYVNNQLAMVGDYIVRNLDGYCYPCKKSLFESTYDKVEE